MDKWVALGVSALGMVLLTPIVQAAFSREQSDSYKIQLSKMTASELGIEFSKRGFWATRYCGAEQVQDIYKQIESGKYIPNIKPSTSKECQQASEYFTIVANESARRLEAAIAGTAVQELGVVHYNVRVTYPSSLGFTTVRREGDANCLALAQQIFDNWAQNVSWPPQGLLVEPERLSFCNIKRFEGGSSPLVSVIAGCRPWPYAEYNFNKNELSMITDWMPIRNAPVGTPDYAWTLKVKPGVDTGTMELGAVNSSKRDLQKDPLCRIKIDVNVSASELR